MLYNKILQAQANIQCLKHECSLEITNVTADITAKYNKDIEAEEKVIEDILNANFDKALDVALCAREFPFRFNGEPMEPDSVWVVPDGIRIRWRLRPAELHDKYVTVTWKELGIESE